MTPKPEAAHLDGKRQQSTEKLLARAFRWLVGLAAFIPVGAVPLVIAYIAVNSTGVISWGAASMYGGLFGLAVATGIYFGGEQELGWRYLRNASVGAVLYACVIKFIDTVCPIHPFC